MSDQNNKGQFENESANNLEQDKSKSSNSFEYSFWAEQISESTGNVNFVLGDIPSEEKKVEQSSEENHQLENGIKDNQVQEENQFQSYSHIESQGEEETLNNNKSEQYGTYSNAETYQQNFNNMNSFSNGDEFHTYENNTMGENNGGKKQKELKKVIGFCVGAVFFGLVAGGTFLGVNELYYYFNPDARVEIADNPLFSDKNAYQLSTTTTLDQAVVPNTDVTEVFENSIPSVVAIKSKFSSSYDWFGQTYEQEEEGSGSGIIVGLTDTELLIVTNNHVVDGATSILTTFIDGSEAEAIVKGTDSSADLAVVSIDVSTLSKDTLKSIKVATLGDSEKVKEGEMAIAIGNALGYGQSITVGYVSAKDRQVEFDNGTMTLLQIDTAINPGNSGGALLNTKGEVIGINCGKLASSQIEGICYAIPISTATPIINELMSREIIKEEDQGYLGVYIDDSTVEANQLYNIPIGVRVVDYTTEDSPAKEAGLLKNDIIVAINGVEIATKTSLKEKVNSYRYGTDVTVTIMRLVNGEYKEMDITVTLGKNPSLVDQQQEEQQNDQSQDQQEEQQNGQSQGQQQPEQPDSNMDGREDEDMNSNPNDNNGNGNQ